MKAILAVAAWTVLGAMAVPAHAQTSQSVPVIQIHVSRTIQAVNYRNRQSTKIDFLGTALLPGAKGQAQITNKEGRTAIEAKFSGLNPATSFGSPFLTYVLWSITPDGRANNLGEVLLDGDQAKLNVTSRLQTFGMIVTAEPYFAVTAPSEMVVLENVIRSDTKGTVNAVDAQYELLKRESYQQGNFPAFVMQPRVPLSYYEALNAIRIAESQKASQYAADSWSKVQAAMAQTEDYLKRKQWKALPTAARDAVQKAEDARVLAVKREQDEMVAQEKAAAAASEAQAKAEAQAALVKQQQEAQARQQAEIQKLQAQVAAAKAEQDAAQQTQARKSAQEAAAKAEAEKQQLRATLLGQFNRVLPTTDTPRGLQANMGDVLFDTGKYNLKSEARESLAKFSGIVLSHPGLTLAVEGYTDNVGSDTFNETLSQQRANSVRDYLIQQGLDPASITAAGFGPTMPVASNDTPQGRQQNRRVEIIISGEVIGTKIGTTTPPQ